MQYKINGGPKEQEEANAIAQLQGGTPADGVLVVIVFFLYPIVPAIHAEYAIIDIEPCIGIEGRTYKKKINIGGEQYADDTGGINEYIVFTGIPYTGYLGKSADDFGPGELCQVDEEYFVYLAHIGQN